MTDPREVTTAGEDLGELPRPATGAPLTEVDADAFARILGTSHETGGGR